MRFTSAPNKKKENPLNHPGITFEMAEEAFEDPNQVVVENYLYSEEGEQRYLLIGVTYGLVLLSVVFVDRSTHDEEIIHIVSARKATKYEEKLYAGQAG